MFYLHFDANNSKKFNITIGELKGNTDVCIVYVSVPVFWYLKFFKIFLNVLQILIHKHSPFGFSGLNGMLLYDV